MPELVIDVHAVRNGPLLIIRAAPEGKLGVTARILASEVSSPEALAEWLMAQSEGAETVYPQFQRRYAITFHTEMVFEEETGLLVEQKLIDSVFHQPLPSDAGVSNFKTLPGWADWTGDQAADWIASNVNDLSGAKTALVAMARAIVYLRSIVIR